jgi:Ni,Fe-hydrogenase I large subunit
MRETGAKKIDTIMKNTITNNNTRTKETQKRIKYKRNDKEARGSIRSSASRGTLDHRRKCSDGISMNITYE